MEVKAPNQSKVKSDFVNYSENSKKKFALLPVLR